MRTSTPFAAFALAIASFGTQVLAETRHGGGLHICSTCRHVVNLSPAGASDVHQSATAAALAPLSETFALHSLPSASKTIYLDFDGHVTTDPGWEGGRTLTTPAFDPANNGPSFLDWELQRIQYIWQRVAEDFSPFNVNITTQEPPQPDLIRSGAGDTRWGVRVAIGDNTWAGGFGGLALMNSFNNSRDTPAFVFENGLGNGNEKYIAEAITHEVGHTLGLAHDGRTSPSEGYYAGHGSGATGWAPIMGVGYYQNLSQWSKGEYAFADQKQDDLAIITSRNGFGYRADDHGNGFGAATPLTVTNDTDVSAYGIISTSTDRDVFSFMHGGGVVELRADPFDRGPNLDILMELLDANGNLLASSNPVSALYAQLAHNLLPGLYYLAIDGVGMGDPLGSGYTDYGSLGQYFINGTIGAFVPEPAGLMVLASLALLAMRRRRRA